MPRKKPKNDFVFAIIFTMSVSLYKCKYMECGLERVRS